MTGLRKDHKVGWDEQEGPPTRPLVNGKVGPNHSLGNLVSRILRPLRKEAVEGMGTEVVSTEELLRTIEDFNKGREGGEGGGVGGSNRTREYRARGCKQMQGGAYNRLNGCKKPIP